MIIANQAILQHHLQHPHQYQALLLKLIIDNHHSPRPTLEVTNSKPSNPELIFGKILSSLLVQVLLLLLLLLLWWWWWWWWKYSCSFVIMHSQLLCILKLDWYELGPENHDSLSRVGSHNSIEAQSESKVKPSEADQEELVLNNQHPVHSY